MFIIYGHIRIDTFKRQRIWNGKEKRKKEMEKKIKLKIKFQL